MRKPLIVSEMTPEELEALRARAAARAVAELEAAREKRREYRARWRADNPEKARASIARWSANNVERVRATNARYRTENKEAHSARARNYRKDNKEIISVRRKAKYAANPEPERNRSRKYQNDNRKKVRAAKQRRNYGITQEQWDTLFTSQGNKCGNCPSTDPGTKKHWHTDHDHETGEVRGILCHHCNALLGYAKDDIDILLKAVEYLKNPPARKILKCENV